MRACAQAHTEGSLRSREISGSRSVACSRDGSFTLADTSIAEGKCLPTGLPEDQFVLPERDQLGSTASAWKLARRRYYPNRLDYLILVPTLRCNLSCSYCQVPRAHIERRDFDWSDKTLEEVLSLIDGIEGDSIKVEFQGGEPTLRCDLIRAVVARCERFAERSFVICTNLERWNDEIEALVARPDVHISTSLDGDEKTHAENRLGSSQVRHHLRRLIDE